MSIDETTHRREQVSALADGQLDGPEFDAVAGWAASDADARATWHAYHLVGDVLRSAEFAACGHDRDFVARLSERVLSEPVVQRASDDSGNTIKVVANNDHLTLALPVKIHNFREAANHVVFRWRLVAGVASLAALAVICWNGLSLLGWGESDAGQLARSTPAAGAVVLASPRGGATETSLADSGAPVMIRDARLDELLAAHRQFGGTSALQNPSGFLRSATFEGVAR